MKKLIEQLVQVSYTVGVLNSAIVEKIAAKLTRKQLKAYIRALKTEERRRTIYVEVASEHEKPAVSELEKIFGQKNFRVTENPALLLGLRITDNDDVYNVNLKTSLERIKDYATE